MWSTTADLAPSPRLQLTRLVSPREVRIYSSFPTFPHSMEMFILNFISFILVLISVFQFHSPCKMIHDDQNLFLWAKIILHYLLQRCIIKFGFNMGAQIITCYSVGTIKFGFYTAAQIFFNNGTK